MPNAVSDERWIIFGDSLSDNGLSHDLAGSFVSIEVPFQTNLADYSQSYTNGTVYADTWMELTTLLIPGENDSEAELDAMTAWVVEHLGPDVPMHFTAFHPAWRMLDRPRTPLETLRAARRIALGNGVRHAYTGNVDDPEGDLTLCHACGAPLVRRARYEILEYALTPDGSCRQCGAACPGRFKAEPGSWGARRRPLRLSETAE